MRLRFVLLLMLAGCSPDMPCVNYLECPDGPADCVQQAQETCPSGYHVLKESDVGADFGAFAQQHFGGPGVPHLIVTCN